MKTNYSEETNSISKVFLITLTKWEGHDLLSGDSILTLAGKFYRLSFYVFISLGLNSLAFQYFLTIRNFNDTVIKANKIISNAVGQVLKLMPAVLAYSYRLV